MKNITIDYHNLGIFPKKQGHSLQFPEKSRGDHPLLPGTLRLVTYFKIFMSPKKVSRIYWMEGEIQWAKKEKSCKWT